MFGHLLSNKTNFNTPLTHTLSHYIQHMCTAELLTPKPRTWDGGGISRTLLLGAKGRARPLGPPANRKCSHTQKSAYSCTTKVHESVAFFMPDSPSLAGTLLRMPSGDPPPFMACTPHTYASRSGQPSRRLLPPLQPKVGQDRHGGSRLGFPLDGRLTFLFSRHFHFACACLRFASGISLPFEPLKYSTRQRHTNGACRRVKREA